MTDFAVKKGPTLWFGPITSKALVGHLLPIRCVGS